jgi:proline iminopeptidase
MATEPIAAGSAGIIDVEGARLPYRIEGQGQPCVVLGSVAFYAREFSQELRQRLQLVFLDLRHFVAADPSFPPDRISIDTYADDIEQARTTLGLGDVVVIGHSIHATVALEYARRYPEHVLGVVVTGGVPASEGRRAARDRHWETEASEERKQLLARAEAELTPEVEASLSPAEFFVRDYVASGAWYWYDPTYDAAWLWEGVEPNMPVLERLAELLDPYDLGQGPGQITTPVLIAHGRYDFGAPYPLWGAHRHKLPRHTYVLFEESAHTPSLEEPEQFDQTLLAWIDGLAISG